MSQIESLPDWMIGPDGKLKQFIPRLDVSKGQFHVFAPSGIGDVAWTWAKLWKVHEDLKADGRELVWHFPALNTNRVEPYARLVGMNLGCYIHGMKDFREFHGEPIPQDFETGGVMFVHANCHMESGRPLHKQCPKYGQEAVLLDRDTWKPTRGIADEEWCPFLPFRNPAPPVIDIETPQDLMANVGQVCRWIGDAQSPPYIVVHMGPMGWMGQNWFPKIYARIIRRLEEIAPVMVMGYSPTGDMDIIEAVREKYEWRGGDCIDQSYSTALSMLVNSKAMFGIDDGMTIMSTYYGVDTFRMYPEKMAMHAHEMPGTFEDCETLHKNNTWCFLEDTLDGALDEWMARVKA